MKKLLKLIGLAAVVFAVATGPALAVTVTNTFTGTVSSGSDSTFGAGSLAGDAFTLTLTMDTTLGGVHQPNFNINGGTGSGPYSGSDPFTAVSLTINGHTFNSVGNQGAALFPQTTPGGGEVTFNPFNQPNQTQTESIYIDLNVLLTAFSLGYNVPLPSMLLSNGDFANLGSSFFDSNGSLVFDVTAVNSSPVPIPPSALLLGSGLLGLVGLGWRRQTSV